MHGRSARVLVVEDDLLIAMETVSLLRQCGCEVIGPVGRLEKGLGAAEQTELDGAVLDIHLGPSRVWPLAELLDERRVPFAFLSGYGRAEIPGRFRNVPLLAKPTTAAKLRRALVEIGVIAA